MVEDTLGSSSTVIELGPYADFSVIHGTSQFKCHRGRLCEIPYFKTQLSLLDDSVRSIDMTKVIDNFGALELVLNYLYGGNRKQLFETEHLADVWLLIEYLGYGDMADALRVLIPQAVMAEDEISMDRFVKMYVEIKTDVENGVGRLSELKAILRHAIHYRYVRGDTVMDEVVAKLMPYELTISIAKMQYFCVRDHPERMNSEPETEPQEHRQQLYDELVEVRSSGFVSRIIEYCGGDDKLSRLSKEERDQVCSHLKVIWNVSDENVPFDGLRRYVGLLKGLGEAVNAKEIQLTLETTLGEKKRNFRRWDEDCVFLSQLSVEVERYFDAESMRSDGQVRVSKNYGEGFPVTVMSLSNSQNALLGDGLDFKIREEDMSHAVFVTFKLEIEMSSDYEDFLDVCEQSDVLRMYVSTIQ